MPGLTRLKSRFIIGPLSNGNVSLLLNMAKFAGIPWDMIFGSDLFGHFKPDPETYLGVARMLDLRPDQVMMAAAHNGDLAAARSHGLLTAFFPRPGEYGPHQKRDYSAEQDWDIVATDIETMAARLGCEFEVVFCARHAQLIPDGSIPQVAVWTAREGAGHG